MKTLYRFSPIKTENELLEAIQYTAVETTKLCNKIIGEELKISGLTIFSHYSDEFANLKKSLFQMGEFVKENNGPYVKLYKPIKLTNNKLTLLRIREPDPYRMQVGCNDFEVNNYNEFKEKYFNKSENLRLIKRPEYEMIEFFDPDFDVLAYVISN